MSHLPTISFRDDYTFRGALWRYASSVSVSLLRVTKWKYRFPADTTFSFEYPVGERDEYLRYFIGGLPEFVGHWESQGSSVMVQRPTSRLLLRMTSEGPGQILGVVEEMELGETSLSFDPDKQIVTAYFGPTSIVRRSIPTAVGTTGEQEGEPLLLEVPTTLGIFHLWQDVRTERAVVESLEADVLVPTVGMHLELPPEHQTKDVGALLLQTSNALSSVEAVLSVLSRRHVKCCQVDVISATSTEFCDTKKYLRGFSTPNPLTPLIDPSALGPESLKEIIETFEASPFREPILHCINFLLAYWDSRYIEDQMAAFTAMETLVNGISQVKGEALILADTEFEALRDDLKTTIKTFAAKHSIDASTRSKLYEKLGELRRPAIVGRTVDLVGIAGVEWRDLWPLRPGGAPAELGRELSEAYNRRSLLVHAGKVDSYQLLLSDAASVHAMTERVALKLLGVHDRLLLPWAYGYAVQRRLPQVSRLV